MLLTPILSIRSGSRQTTKLLDVRFWHKADLHHPASGCSISFSGKETDFRESSLLHFLAEILKPADPEIA